MKKFHTRVPKSRKFRKVAGMQKHGQMAQGATVSAVEDGEQPERIREGSVLRSCYNNDMTSKRRNYRRASYELNAENKTVRTVVNGATNR